MMSADGYKRIYLSLIHKTRRLTCNRWLVATCSVADTLFYETNPYELQVSQPFGK